MRKLLLFVIIGASLFGARIVAIGGAVSEVVSVLGHEKDLVGVDISSIYPKSLEKVPKIGYWLKVSTEGIVSLRPSIVIASEKTRPKKVLDELKKLGIKVHIIDDKPNLESVVKKISQVGKILGEEKRAKKIAKRIKKNIASYTKLIPKTNKKVLFLFGKADFKLMAMGKGSSVDAMIELSKAQNVADFENYRILSPEALLKLDPQVIIIGDVSKKPFELKNISNKAVLSTRAAKNKAIYPIDLLLVAGFSTRFDEALRQFSCLVHENKLKFCKK